MIPQLIIAILPVGLVLFISEYLWRRRVLKGERARKFIHIIAGVWMAFWPHYLPFELILLLSLIGLNLLIYSRATGLIHAIYAVKRRTYGELFFALSIMLLAIFSRDAWVFTLAMLFMALGDGGAAVVGRFWGRKNSYYVFGKRNLRKSIAGTTAYIAFVYFSIAVVWFVGGREVIADNPVAILLLLPATVTVLENSSPYGFDNLLTPLFTVLFINSLA